MEIVNRILKTRLQVKHCYSYTPEGLWDVFVEYVRDYSRPKKIKKYGTSGEALGVSYDVEAERPLSLKAFCAYSQIGMIGKGWDNAIDEILRSSHPECAPYKDVAVLISDFVEAQNYEGAVLGQFNASLVSSGLKGQLNKAYVSDSSGGGTTKIEHTINFRSFKGKEKDVD